MFILQEDGVAHSQTAQGQLSIYCRGSLAPLPSSYSILGCSTGEVGGEVGSIPMMGNVRVRNAQALHSPSSDNGAPQSLCVQMAAVDQMLKVQ